MSWIDDLLTKVVAVGGSVFPSRKIINLIAGSGVTIGAVDNEATGSTDVTVASTGGAVPTHLTIDAAGAGHVPAAGAIRLDTTSAQAGIKARDVSNAVDLTFCIVDASNNMQFGSDYSYTNQPQTLGFYSGVALGLGLGSSTYLYCNNSLLQSWVPLFYKDGSLPSSPGGGGVMSSVLGLPYWCDNAGFVHRLAEYRESLNANFTTPAAAALAASNLGFPVTAGDVWEVEIQGWISQASGVAGAGVGLVASGGATFSQEGAAFGTAGAGSALGAPVEMTASGTAYGTFNTVAATKGYVYAKTTVTVTVSGAINIGLQPRAAVAGTMIAGFSMTAKQIKKV